MKDVFEIVPYHGWRKNAMKKIKLFMYVVLILAIVLTIVLTCRWYEAQTLTDEGLQRVFSVIIASSFLTFGIGGEIIIFQIITYFFIDKPKKTEYRNFIVALLVISAVEIISIALTAIIDIDFGILVILLVPAAFFVELAYFITWLKHTIQRKKTTR